MTLLAMYDIEEEEQSPTDTSEDSIEVRVKPIGQGRNMSNPPSAKKNKRKSMEPKRLTTEACETKRCRLNSTGSEDRSPPVSYNSESRSPSPSSPQSKESISPPSKRNATSPMCLAPKKRFKFDALRELEQSASDKKEKSQQDENEKNPVSPFRPWSETSENKLTLPPTTGPIPSVPYIPFLLPGMMPDHAGLPILPIDPRLYPYQLLPPYIPLPAKSDTSSVLASPTSPSSTHSASPALPTTPTSYRAPVQDEPLSLVIKDKLKLEPETHEKPKPSPIKPNVNRQPVFNVEALISAQKLVSPCLLLSPPHPGAAAIRSRNDSGSTSSSGGEERAKQRNYKNMTRERRVEANARERQRVHTITAAFDNLQAAIPTEEENVKLSKLSVIKIATAYIMALSRMAGHDYTEDQSAPPVEEVIQHCSEVIETESRIKKRNTSH
eukprot:GFUD01013261.1.p1 GENE.GFUD01013261.1~~GFUD01013261.1.p1  ORF type:complete len:439 (+),score=95.01 GFUD01013261.1:304-1620(+)